MLASTPFLLATVPKVALPVGNQTALDGAVTAFSGGAFALPALTTTAAGIIVVYLIVNNYVSGTTSVSGSSLGAFTKRAENNVSSGIVEYFAISGGAVTTETITITSPSATYVEGMAFGVKGVKTGTNNGYDANGALANVVASGTLSLTTSNANDFLIAGYRGTTSSPNPPDTGWTLVTTGTFLFVEYKIVTATQSAFSVADPNANNGAIGDALAST